MNVLIDPKMFALKSEKDIKDNIDFFDQLIALSNSGEISVCLYKEIIEGILHREICPFPIKISEIKDTALRETILILNASFVKAVMNHYIELDIDHCCGEQEFITDREELAAQDDYFALFSMLIVPCYLPIAIEDKVLTGKSREGLQAGEEIKILCSCGAKRFERTYQWKEPFQLLSAQQRALTELKKVICQNIISFCENPETIKGDHHNRIQPEDFKNFKELCAKNKRVLSLLRYFGLSKIYFENFSIDTSCEVGTIKICSVREGENSEIITGWLYGCLDFRILVELYFPCGVGYHLNVYTEGELSRMKVEQLKTELGL